MSASASTSTQTGGGPSPSVPSTAASPTLPHSPETQRQIAEARAALEASMSNIGSSLDTALRSRAQNLHANSAQLDKQQKDVVKATEGLKKEGEKLRKLADEGSRKVKELGNVQNWAEMLERDFLVLQETVRLANEDSDSSWETESAYSENGSVGEQAAEQEDNVVNGGIPDSTQAGLVRLVDGEGDTRMQDTADSDKGKEKIEIEDAQVVDPQKSVEVSGSSSTSITGSASIPSSNSAHTSVSAII